MTEVSVVELRKSLPGPDAGAATFEVRETKRFRVEMEMLSGKPRPGLGR